MELNNLGELLNFSAKRFPKKTALIFGSKKITYAQLESAALYLAAGLRKMGIDKGDRVALYLDNCPEFVIGYYAILKAGAVVVPINYMFKSEETEHILNDSSVVAVLTSRAYLDFIISLKKRIKTLKFIVSAQKVYQEIPDFLSVSGDLSLPEQTVVMQKEDLAVILYTSGTTGKPKGAMLSHENLISNAVDSSRAIRVGRKDTFICILPLFHSFAATVCMNIPLLIGAKIVLMKSVRPFRRVIRLIRRHRVSIFTAIPSVYSILKDTKLPWILSTPFIKLVNPVRVCISGAAALPAQTFRDFENKFKLPLLEGYGLTEASPVVTLNPLRGIRKASSIGLPVSSRIKVRIVDENGKDLPPGDVGELIVSGPNVMRGYYLQEEANRQTLRDGWLYTGDMAKFDSEGYIYIVDRKKDMVNVRGLNVYPREIEEVLCRHPEIKEAAVVGIADAHKGEVPKCYLVLKEKSKLTERDVTAYLKNHLASYKIPKYVEFRQLLPKSATGKILKRALSGDEEAVNA